MTNIALNGVCGHMGAVLVEIINAKEDAQVVYGIDKAADKSTYSFPVYEACDKVPADLNCDVIIDFSHFSAVKGLLEFAVERNTPAVICTTGLGDVEKQAIKDAAEKIPVFFSANMSIGICLVKALCAKAATFLGSDFDIEIVEKHHNRKIDAPSGTALAIADAINAAADEKYTYAFDRFSEKKKRTQSEIGFSSVRGGNIVGDHEVIFAGANEVIEISHHAQSRSVFADGAVRAALFLAGKPARLYSMEDMV